MPPPAEGASTLPPTNTVGPETATSSSPPPPADSSLGDAATIRLKLGPAEGTPPEFIPLELPRALEVSLHELKPDRVVELAAELELELQQGSYELPLGDEVPALVDVAAGSRCRSRVAVSHAPDRPKPLIQRASLSFEPALRIRNVLPILGKLHTLFEDRQLSQLLEALSRAESVSRAVDGLGRARSWARRLQAWLGPELERSLPPLAELRAGLGDLRASLAELAKEPERLVLVEIERIVATPSEQDGTWLLDLRFSGTVTYLGRRAIPFRDVLVPRPILPVPHALLDRLLSDEPFVSASVRRERLAGTRLLEGMTNMLASFLGSFTAVVDVPRIDAAVHLADAGRIDLNARGPRLLSARGSFAGVATHDEVRFRTRDLSLQWQGAGLELEVDTVVSAAGRGRDPSPSVGRRWLDWARTLEWPPKDIGLDVRIRIQPGSKLPPIRATVHYEHPVALGGLDVPARIAEGELGGELSIHVDPRSSWPRHSGSLDLSGTLELLEGASFDDGLSSFRFGVGESMFRSRLDWTDREGLTLELRADAELDVSGTTRIDAFPELDIEAGSLSSMVRGRVSVDGHVQTTDLTAALLEADFSGTKIELLLDQAALELGSRGVELPAASTFVAHVSDAVLATSGLGRGAIEVNWDLGRRSPLLRGDRGWVELLVPALRRGSLEVRISPAGGLDITGAPGGLYDARFFNALLNPGSEPERWLDILLTDEAIDRVLAAIRVFSADLARMLEQVRRFALRARDALRAEGISQPRDFIPADVIARVISRLLVDTPALASEVLPLVKRVTDGVGLDVPAVRRLLAEHLPSHEYEWEIDRALRWLAPVLAPSEPVAPRERLEMPALCEDPRFVPALAELPTAAELYAQVDSSEPLSHEFASRVVRVAPYLTLEQVEYVLGRERQDWPMPELARLRYVAGLKHRVRLIAENYGGLSFAPQALAIGFFLGEAARIRSEDSAHPPSVPPPSQPTSTPNASPPWAFLPDSILGPEDIAVLLQASLASAWQGRIVQLNRRLLLDLVLGQPAEFLREVLVEMAGGSARALGGSLYALLNQAQDRMRDPLDMPAVLGSRLGLAMPRLEDYMAGGRWAKLSYWEALSRTAEQILAESDPYLAKRARIQTFRHSAPQPVQVVGPIASLCAHAEQAIAEADAVGAGIDFRASDPARVQEARTCYEAAFAACSALLAAEPQAFQLDWFRRFWARNYEALMVWSVVRNVQQEVDDVRAWLAKRSGRDDFEDEQTLVEIVIGTLYFHEADRVRLGSDPLVRLLIDPPAGHYDFTIVSAMGVITEGARGRELEEAYERLERTRGIRTIRAPTATARGLEHNAAQIEQALRDVATPWGYIGYSQGCANGLRAEARLLGGTPEQQQLARGLRSRHLLFSALNGSAHGTCGDRKFLAAMADADRFLKHYQAIFSRQAIRFAVDNLKLLLDSRPMVHSLGGVSSLSYEGVRALARDGQFKATVPTTSMRGIVEPGTLPEALEFLGHVLTRQLQSPEHDTQVEVHEAVGHSVQVDNPHARVLDRCDIGALVQRTHHWSPLVHETAFVTTARDRELAIYDTPKDRHVVPWIEVNARFGVIRRAMRAGRP